MAKKVKQEKKEANLADKKEASRISMKKVKQEKKEANLADKKEVSHISMKEVKQEMEETNLADQNEININLRVIKTVRTAALKVKRSDTIFEIKNKLQRVEGVDLKLQELFFSGRFLQNDMLLSEYNVVDGSIVNVHVSAGLEMKIYVEMPMGKTIALNVKEGDTVRRIKEMVRDTTRIPPERQTLVHAGTALNDTQALSACNIVAESTVHMVVKERDGMEILITFPDDEVVSFNVQMWYTIWDVKTLIKSRMHVTQEKQRLTYNEKRLKDRLTLAECNFGFRPMLELSYETLKLHRMQIQINMLPGSITTVCVHSCDSVYVLMKRIKEEDASCDQHSLVFEGRRMIDDWTLEDYNVCEGSTIDLFKNFIGS